MARSTPKRRPYGWPKKNCRARSEGCCKVGMAEASAATTIHGDRPSFVYSSGGACLRHAGGHGIPDLHAGGHGIPDLHAGGHGIPDLHAGGHGIPDLATVLEHGVGLVDNLTLMAYHYSGKMDGL